MKFIALSALLLAIHAGAKPSPPLPPLIDFSKYEGGNLRGRELQEVDPSCTPSIEVSVVNSFSGGCFGSGQEINVTVTTCPTPFPEWVGIFSGDDGEFEKSNNWAYCCGDQDCEEPVGPSSYTLTFGAQTSGSDGWPYALTDSFGGGGGTYNIYFHTGYGSISASISIQITPGYFCAGPFAGVPANETPPEWTPCPVVNFTRPCLEYTNSSSDSDSSDDGDSPCQKITPSQGGIPPGQGGIPPGLQCKGFIPPGIAKKLGGQGRGNN